MTPLLSARGPRIILALVIAALAIVVVVFAANGRGAPAAPSYGDTMTMGNGSMRSFVTMNNDDNPSVIGLEFDATAITGLSTSPLSDGRWDIPAADGSVAWVCCGYEVVLTPPAGTPFEHIVVNWNPGRSSSVIAAPPTTWRRSRISVRSPAFAR